MHLPVHAVEQRRVLRRRRCVDKRNLRHDEIFKRAEDDEEPSETTPQGERREGAEDNYWYSEANEPMRASDESSMFM